MHHLAFLVTDFDEQLAAARAANPELASSSTAPAPATRCAWVYLDGQRRQGTVIELLERTPQSEALYSTVRELVRR